MTTEELARELRCSARDVEATLLRLAEHDAATFHHLPLTPATDLPDEMVADLYAVLAGRERRT